MHLRTDIRGQTIQIGAVLLFGLLIVMFSTYQATVVPNQNAQTEYTHSQAVQSQMATIRNTIATPPDRGVSTSVEIDLGTPYSNRIVGVNPNDPSGTLRTVGTTDSNIDVQLKNAETARGTPNFWDGDTSFNTGAVVYQPNYNEYRAPETVYEHRALYNRGDSSLLTLAESSMIDGKNINLVMLNGSVFESRSGTVSLDITTIDTSKEPLQLTNDGGDPLEIQFFSRQPASYWERLEGGDKGAYIEDISSTDGGDGWHVVTIELTQGEIYDVTLTEVGIGEQVADRKRDGTKISMAAADSMYRTQFEAWRPNPRPSRSCSPSYMGSYHPTPVEDTSFIGGACNFGQNAATERTVTLPNGKYQVGVTYWPLQSWDIGEAGTAEWIFSGNTLTTETWDYGPSNRGDPHKETFTVTHPGGTATLKFGSDLDSSARDESFGISNVWIRHIDDG